MDSLRTAPRSHLSGRQWPHFAVWYALFSQQALVELRRNAPASRRSRQLQARRASSELLRALPARRLPSPPGDDHREFFTMVGLTFADQARTPAQLPAAARPAGCPARRPPLPPRPISGQVRPYMLPEKAGSY